jgi:hypothetical protein
MFRRRPAAPIDAARTGAWNTRVLGAVLARQCYDARLAGPGVPLPPEPEWIGLAGCLCRQADLESAWLHHWAGALGMVPFYHRAVWDAAFIAQAAWEAGALQPGRRALGLAAGRSVLPGFLAARGVDVLATDLHPEDPRAAPLPATAAPLPERLAFRPLDLAQVPPDLYGRFDLVFSTGALARLGGARAAGDYLLAAMRCLRPGGTAVHVTGFDLGGGAPPTKHGPFWLRAADMEQITRRLHRAGHRMKPVDLDPGAGLLDQFVDQPAERPDWPLRAPDGTPQLRALVEGRIVTSVGLVVQAPG